MKTLVGFLLVFFLPLAARAGLPPIAVPDGSTVRFLAPGLKQAGICTFDSNGKITSVPGGSAGRATNTVSANFSIPTLTRDYLLNVNSSSGAVAVTLPDAVSSSGLCADVKNTGSPANGVTITAFGGQTIDGQASYLLSTSNESAHLCAVGGSWFNY